MAMTKGEYSQYLRSEHWKEFKIRCRRAGMNFCKVCGIGDEIHLHHQTYERIGAELLEDVVPLCKDCHKQLHRWLKQERVGVDFTGKSVESLKNCRQPKRVKKKRKHKPTAGEIKYNERKQLIEENARAIRRFGRRKN